MVKNPLFLSAGILAFLFYSGIVPVKKCRTFHSLLDKTQIRTLEGWVSSNPVKSPLFGSSYKTGFVLFRAASETAVSEASGDVTLYIPEAIVESFYPGKLYSRAKTDDGKIPLIESGARLRLSVEKIKKTEFEDSYLVKEAFGLGWEGNSLLSRLYRFRAVCRLQFKRLMYSWGKAGGLLLALLTGSREYTEKSISDAFRNSGLSHILALSGMHLGLFGAVACFFGRKAGGRNFGDALQLCAVSFFVFFAGISPSLFRAFLAALILYLNSLFRMNRPDALTLLSLCFILHILIFSNHIFEPAFMFSYASLGGIIIFGKVFRKVYPVFIPHRLRLSLSDSTAAQLATAPVSIKLFGTLMPQGIIASLFLAPLVFLFLYTGLFGIIICLILPFLSPPISAIMNGLYLLISTFVLFFSFR